MSRQIVQLHTIEQWFGLHPQVQQVVLRALRVKERLWAWRLVHEQKKVKNITEGHWVQCRRCHPEYPGWQWKHPRKQGIHPSSMYNSCLLKIYYETIGVEPEMVHEARDLLIFDIGTAGHDMIQNMGLAGAWGPSYQVEVPIEHTPLAQELMIVGHADAENILVVDDIPGTAIFEVGIVHEYKTINDNGFQGLKGRPKAQHKMQATIYSACLNRPIVVYLYFNKNNSNIEDFPIVFEPHVWEKMRQKAQAVRDAVVAQTPPPGNVSYECSNCGFQKVCTAYQAALAQKSALKGA